MSVEHYNGVQTDVVWPIVSKWLNGVEARTDDVTLNSMYERLLKGTAVLFLVSLDGKYVAAALGEIAVTARTRCFWVEAMGGEDMPRWIHELSDDIAEYARSMGLEKVACEARPGVAARLRALDQPQRWRRGVTTMTLELNNHG